jgi:opacity protein-like surface antigen
MKKVVLVLLLAALVAGVTFAQDLSMSGGLGFKFASYTDTITGSSGGVSSTETEKNNKIGINLFFDAKYVEVNLDYLYNKTVAPLIPGYDITFQWNYLALGLVGKYPFALGDKFTLFPYAGIDYLMLVSCKVSSSWGGDIGTYDIKDKGDYNRLSFVFGVGGDYQITDQLYIRATAGVGFGLDNKKEKDGMDAYPGIDWKTTHIQIPIKLCVGYKL